MAKKKRFSLDTRAFAQIWANHISKPSANDWRKFVLALFERFTSANELSNQAFLLSQDKQWKKWDDEKKYSFLSERAYSKATVLRRNLKENGQEVELPDGYKTRKGNTSTRVTISELGAIFAKS